MNSFESELKSAILAQQNGDFETAGEIYDRLLRIDSHNAQILFLKGSLFFQKGALHAALAVFQRILKRNPADPLVLNATGLVYQSMDDHSNAVFHFQRALSENSEQPDVLTNLGVSLLETGESEQALQSFISAIRIEGRTPSALYNLALALDKLERHAEAANLYREILELDPDSAPALNSYAFFFYRGKQYNEALAFFRKAAASDPSFFDAWYNIGNVLCDMQRYTEAYQSYQTALSLSPDSIETLDAIGAALHQLGDFKQSEHYFRQALLRDETFVLSHLNLGLTLHESGRFSEAIESYDKGLQYSPENYGIHFAKAYSLLQLGLFREGWHEYEWRLRFPDYAHRAFPFPQWNGETLQGKVIYVYTEQGFGDAFQFIRYLRLLKQFGAVIIYESRESLLRLWTQQGYADFIITEPLYLKNSSTPPNQPIPPCDYYIPLMSLPKVFQTSLTSIPADVPYMSAEPSLAAAWRERLASYRGIKIGIAWAGRTTPWIARKRHMPLNFFERLSSFPNATLFSLQVEFGIDQIPVRNNNFPLIDLAPEIHSFSDTAAIIENLDLIISVDTSIVHLAGAMGKPVWTLLAYVGDWRYLEHRTDSPWYPSMRLFRQSSLDDWESVFRRVHEALADFLRTAVSHTPLPLYLALPEGSNFGWGICSSYLKKEIAKKRRIFIIEDEAPNPPSVGGVVFHALRGIDLIPYKQTSGTRNIGYTFFESELTERSLANSAFYDLVLAGSTWCKDRLNEAGIHHTGVLLQGVDPELFYPIPEPDSNLFVLFSGGKFELRKGQDLVLRAFEILHKKYSDMILLNAWFNLWQETAFTMQASRYIDFVWQGSTWEEIMTNIYLRNGIDPSRVITLGLTENTKMRDMYAHTHLGIFPNRCEGGTNLVLMEYMACGKPVVASYNTGHRDILTETNSLRLMNMRQMPIVDEHNDLIARWEDPSLDELIERIEFAYHHREQLHTIGINAGESLRNLPWSKSAETLLNFVDTLK